MDKTQSKVDFIIRLGLGDWKKITWYRRVMMDPHNAVTNPQLRPYMAEILDRLLDYVFEDSMMWTRLQWLLRQDRIGVDMKESDYEALIKKADRSGIPVEILEEVYRRGAVEATDNPENAAFNRVNSFIAGGKARILDGDLLSEGDRTFYLLHGGEHTGHVYRKSKETYSNWIDAKMGAEHHSKQVGQPIHVYRLSGDHLMHTSTHRVGPPRSDLEIYKRSIHRDQVTEEYGAGFDGTTELADRYRKDTPGQLLTRIKKVRKNV